MTICISYGLSISLATFRSVSELKICTLKDLFDILKITRKIFRIRDPTQILQNVYSYSWRILQDDKILHSHIKRLLRKIKIKKLKLEYKEIKISKEEDIRIPEGFPVIYIDKSLLPEFVYIMHDLHAKILKKILTNIPREIKIEGVKHTEYSLNEIVLGVKIGLQPLFALALFYNSKYGKNLEFYINYIRFVNKLAVKVNKIIDILENNKVEKEVLLEIAEDIRKIRNEGLL